MYKSFLKILTLFILIGFLFVGSPQEMSISDGIQNSEVDLDYGSLPLYFVSNEGQVNEQALFYAKTSRYSLWLTKNGLVFDDIATLIFLGAETNPEVQPVGTAECKINSFIGSDESKWRTDIPTSKAVLYRGLYPYIDLKVYGVESQVEYDWIIEPGGRVSDIRFLLSGVKETSIDEEQNLSVKTELSELKHKKPECYQFIDGERIPVEGSFHEIEENTYGIVVEEYNKDYELVIDPVVLVYSTYLGGRKYDSARAIAVDSAGAAYITGWTYSKNFPTKNPIQKEYISKNRTAFVAKINPAGNGLVYSTYLGGSGDDYSYDLAVDSTGAVYVTGKAYSQDFPLKNPFQAMNKGSDDVFITKISPDGSELVFSSFLGGTGQEWGTGVDVDSKGAAYVCGATTSADFPIKNAFQDKYIGAKTSYPWDCFISKIHPQGKRLVYSSFLGGNEFDFAREVAVNSKGEAYITGNTSSKNFPKKKAVQKTLKGTSDAFVCKVHRNGKSLLYSTFLGGSDYDSGRGIAVDSKGAAYVTGDTVSVDFPLKNAIQENITRKTSDEEANDVFVTKLTSKGNKIVYSTLLGGNNYDDVNDIAVDSSFASYVTGTTASKNFPKQNPFQKNLKGGTDAFISKIQRNGKSLLFSTFLGGSLYETGYGIAVDAQGRVYVTGRTSSKDFPKKKAIQKKIRGSGEDIDDAFITKLKID